MRECESGRVARVEAGARRTHSYRDGRTHARTAGFTLLELMVVLAILAVMGGVVGLAVRSLDETDPAAQRAAAIADARRRALETRRPVVLQVAEGDSARRMVAFPDGSVRADSALGLEVLTGRPREAR